MELKAQFIKSFPCLILQVNKDHQGTFYIVSADVDKLINSSKKIDLDLNMADRKKGKIKINRELCKGCYLCISVCPKQIISVSESLNRQGYYPAKSTDDDPGDQKCTGCAMCATMCPDVAIEVYRD